ncbi:unnamed protein product [Zymoseptoria tritici ST99CH_3D1]|nr:unnamed protein product [Zymoseptoria tritici ST99CH_3D1]
MNPRSPRSPPPPPPTAATARIEAPRSSTLEMAGSGHPADGSGIKRNADKERAQPKKTTMIGEASRPAAQTTLAFNSIDEAVRSPAMRFKVAPDFDDVHIVKANEKHFVARIVNAMASDSKAPCPTGMERSEWNTWLNKYEHQVTVINEFPPSVRQAEWFAWMILKEVYDIHENGILNVAKASKNLDKAIVKDRIPRAPKDTLKCSDRLELIITTLRDYGNVAADAIVGEFIRDIAENPMRLVQRKITSKLSNARRASKRRTGNRVGKDSDDEAEDDEPSEHARQPDFAHLQTIPALDSGTGNHHLELPAPQSMSRTVPSASHIAERCASHRLLHPSDASTRIEVPTPSFDERSKLPEIVLSPTAPSQAHSWGRLQLYNPGSLASFSPQADLTERLNDSEQDDSDQ